MTADRTEQLPDGRLIGFAEYGDPEGLPVLAFHGTPGSRFMFKLTHEPAKGLGLRIIAPERPGFGLSTMQRGRTIAGWAHDMSIFADLLGLEKFAIAGISGGGPYAAACAALLPERVLATAIISPVGPVRGPECPSKIGPAHHLTFRVLPELPLFYNGMFNVGRLGFLRAPSAIYAMIMGRVGPSDWRILSRMTVRRNLLEGVAEGLRPGVAGALAEIRLFSKPWNIPFEKVRSPCFLWQGTADRNVPPPSAFRLGDLIPGCRVTRLEGAGHYWIFDNMDTVLRTLAGAASSANIPGQEFAAKRQAG